MTITADKNPLTVDVRIADREPVMGILTTATDLINTLDGVQLPDVAAEKLAALKGAMLDADLITPSDD